MKRRNLLLATSGIASGLLTPAVRAAQPCPPPLLSVSGGGSTSTTCQLVSGASTLATLAASMAPGTWARLTPANDQNPIFGVGWTSGTMLHYCGSMPWNPVSKVIEIIGMDHNYTAQRHVRYVEATNQLVLVNEWNTGHTEHGYDHNAVNPYTGDLYHRRFTGFTGQISALRKPPGATSFTPIPSIAANDQVAIGACWWSGSFVGAGNQGCFVLFNTGNATGTANDGQILAYDPLAGRWFYNQEGKAPFYASANKETYHSVMEYSAKKNLAVFGGGNAAPTKLWRLASDGSSVPLSDVPAGKGVGMQRGLLVDEPVTGNFLLLSAGELWELNPAGAGVWTRQAGQRVPPAAVGIPGPTNPQGVICSAIPAYGVVAFITQPSQSGGSFFLYKHA